jgi:hypothetical protein
VTTPFGQTISSGDLFVPPSPFTAADVEFTGRMSIGGDSQRVTISTGGKIGLVVFDGTAGQRVSLALAGVTFSSVGVAIYQPSGSLLSSIQVGSSGGDLDNIQLPVSGTYMLSVDPLNNYTGGVTVTLTEPVGTALSFGTPLTVSLQSGQDARLPFPGTAGQRVSLGATGISGLSSSSTTGVWVSLLRQDGSTPVASRQVGYSGGDMDSAALPATETYYVRVTAGPRSGSITLTLTEPVGTALSFGTPLTVSLLSGQDARLPFSGLAGQRVSLGATGISSLAWSSTTGVWITLLRQDGTTAVNSVANQSTTQLGYTGGDVDSVPLPGTETYYVRVTAGPRSGSMTLVLTEPVGGVLDLNMPVSVSLASGQDARLSFQGTQNEVVTVEATGISTLAWSSTTGVWLSLLRQDGSTQVASQEVGYTGGSLANVTLPASETYLVRVTAGPRSGDIILTRR